MNKSSDQRIPFLLIFLSVFSFILWWYLFRLFLNGSAPLQGDAYPYLGHIRFYVENIMRGVYPLWDPLENHGQVNEFFLRRIGEFNPFFWVIVFLNKIGLPFVIAYRLFLVMYFFFGVAGFYLLSQEIFHDQVASFTTALLVLFSSIGPKIFESYLLLEIVPFIWFSYFLVAFIKSPHKVFFLGAVFSLMLINITYIPFYFYIILFVFFFSYFVVYTPLIGHNCQSVKNFIKHNNIFILVCAVLLAVSFIPGISFYRQGQQQEVVTQRHEGSQNKNSFTVCVNKINLGGIIPDVIFDKEFVNLDRIGLQDPYVPLFVFLMLFAGMWGRLNRRLVCFFIFGYMVFLIGLADACPIAYKVIPFLGYFRNFQFFLWYVVLPILILFVVEQMRIFIDDCRRSSINRGWMTLWVALVHACAIGIFLHSNYVGWTTYAVIIFNLGWMLECIWSGNSRVWVLLLWAAIVLQPFEVYSHIAVNYPPSYQWGYDKRYILNLPASLEAQEVMNRKTIFSKDGSQKDFPYLGIRWQDEAIESINNAVLSKYLGVPFILYNRIEQDTNNTDLKRLQSSLNHFENVAFVYSNTMNNTGGPRNSKARIITSVDKDFKLLKFDTNDVIVKTSFAAPSFLVRTQNYYPQWKAFIDGKPTPLLRTNIFVQGLWVPAGEHVVHWHFGTPFRYFWAYLLEFLYPAVLLWLIWLCFRLRMSA